MHVRADQPLAADRCRLAFGADHSVLAFTRGLANAWPEISARAREQPIRPSRTDEPQQCASTVRSALDGKSNATPLRPARRGVALDLLSVERSDV